MKERLACVASPICAMGWGRDEFGTWIPPISFRIRESAEDFDETLQVASFSGQTYEVTREDGLKDEIYLMPAAATWVKEPTGRWRIFKYYSERKSVIMRTPFSPPWHKHFSLCLA